MRDYEDNRRCNDCLVIVGYQSPWEIMSIMSIIVCLESSTLPISMRDYEAPSLCGSATRIPCYQSPWEIMSLRGCSWIHCSLLLPISMRDYELKGSSIHDIRYLVTNLHERLWANSLDYRVLENVCYQSPWEIMRYQWGCVRVELCLLPISMRDYESKCVHLIYLTIIVTNLHERLWVLR